MKKLFAALLTVLLLSVSTVCVNADTPELPENNRLLSDTWTKLLGGVKISEEVVDGVKITSVSNIDTTYSSAGLDIMPTVETLMGEDDELDVWIVLDVRVDAEDGKEFPFGMKVRARDLTALTQTKEAFDENYPDASVLVHRGGSQGVSVTVHSGTITNQWQRIEIYLTLNEMDVNREFWGKLCLCFDMMSEFEDMGTLQIKNAGVYLFDEYEALEEDGEEKEEIEYITPVTPSPATIYRPYEFDKYTATFAEVKEQDENRTDADVVTPTDGTINSDNDDNKDGIGIIIAIVIAVIAIGAVAVIVVKKSKKERKGDAEE